MAQRLELQALLVSLLGSDNVYFQAPPSNLMQYPCILYSLDGLTTDHANNLPYNHRKSYSVTVIDRDPDSDIPEKVAGLPLCAFDRQYTTDNLYHNVFTLFF